MKRVLHLTLYLDIGGLERMILLLSREQRARGMEPCVLVYERGTAELLPEFERNGVPVVFAPKGHGFSMRLPFRILGLLRAREITLIHSHDLGALIYASLARLLSFGRVRVVHTQHSFQHLVTRKARLYERIFPWLASVVVCVSEDLRRTYLSLGQPLDHLRIVPNGVDFNQSVPSPAERHASRLALLQRYGLPELLVDKTWVVSLGRLARVKGLQHALRMWSRARTEGAALICVGPEAEPGFLAELKKAAKENVYFPGPSLDPRSWLAASDLFLSASEFEGLPLAGLEAASVGLPMLLSEIPGHALFRDWAAYFPLSDVGQGSALLERFISAGDLGEHTGDRGVLKRLERICGARQMTDAYAEIYENAR